MFPWPNWNAETLGTIVHGDYSLFFAALYAYIMGVIAWRVQIMAD